MVIYRDLLFEHTNSCYSANPERSIQWAWYIMGVASPKRPHKMASEGEQVLLRRNRPGTKAKDFYSWPAQDFNDMDTILAGKSIVHCHTIT